VTVTLTGGPLQIAWREDGHLVMTGSAATSFHGTFDPADFGIAG
jgi:diaminopimelate epimerase